MKQFLTFFAAIVVATAIAACTKTTDEQRAAQMIETIEQSIGQGDFRSALDSITILRDRYPKAIEARKRALELWQEASLLQARSEAEQTDSLLKETLEEIEKAPTLLEQNKLRNRRDSLQARYDAAMGLVKIIRAKQNGK